MGGLGASAYMDVPAYLRAATNQETASLVGLATTLGGAGTVAAGTTALPVAASTGWAAGPLWLLDGPYCEVVQVTGAPDVTTLSLAAPGTRFAHAAGVSASQAGTAGALAEALLRASAWIEGYCQQGSAAGDRSLFAVSRTERWGMPGPRAWVDRDGVLAVRPGHFPLASVEALSVERAPGEMVTLDAARLELASDGRLVEAPLAEGASAGVAPGAGLSRWRRQWVTLTYTGGIPLDAVPYDIQQACVWLASDILAQRRNPSGAALVRQGKFEMQARPWADRTGDSILTMRAKAALEPWRARGL